MKLTIVNQTSEKLNTKWLKQLNRTLGFVLNSFEKKRLRQKAKLFSKTEIIFVFLSPAAMKKINSKYRGKNKPTDVLSFTSEDKATLGELLFCNSVLRKQAKEQKHSLELELTYMMIHGILHLLGYDHEISDSEQVLMYRIQNSCFTQVRHLLS